MKPKLLYCLALIATLLILSITVFSKDTTRPCLFACNKIEVPAETPADTVTDFIFLESFTKYLIISFR